MDIKNIYSKKLRIVMVATILGLVFSRSIVIAQHLPDSTDIQRRIAEAVYDRLGIAALVDTNGVILGLSGDRMNIGLNATDPVERSFQFLELHADLFGFINPREEFTVKNYHPGPHYTYDYSGAVFFQQMVEGVKVVNAGYQIHYDPDSTSFKFTWLVGRIIPEARRINTTPTVSQMQAESMAMSDPEHAPYLEQVTIGLTELVIESVDNVWRLAWKINVQNGRFAGSANYWIDANTAEVLKMERGSIY